MTKAEQEALRKIFDELPQAFPQKEGSEDIRIINYPILLEMVRQLTNNSRYLEGYTDGQNHATKVALGVMRGEYEQIIT